MKIETNEHGDILLKEVYSGLALETSAGEFMGICMRDTGFEFNYEGVSYSAQKGVITKITQPNPEAMKNKIGNLEIRHIKCLEVDMDDQQTIGNKFELQIVFYDRHYNAIVEAKEEFQISYCDGPADLFESFEQNLEDNIEQVGKYVLYARSKIYKNFSFK